MEMDNLEKIRDGYKSMIKNIPKKYLGAYLKSLTSSSTPVQVKAKCYECIGFEIVNEAITDCRGWTCPLYWSRPYSYPDTQKVRGIIKQEFFLTEENGTSDFKNKSFDQT
jgi:hypothetical protein